MGPDYTCMSEGRGERLSSRVEGGAGVLPRTEHRHGVAERRRTVSPIGPDARCVSERRDGVRPIGPDCRCLAVGHGN